MQRVDVKNWYERKAAVKEEIPAHFIDRHPIGVTVNPKIGLGDAIQFSSLPENYFRVTGMPIVDVSKCWVFDHNPYVIRDVPRPPSRTIELWNFGGHAKWAFKPPRDSSRPQVYLSNAEIWAAAVGVPVSLNRPRLYVYEDFPFESREAIFLHTDGRSHGTMPEEIIAHVIQKYGKTGKLFLVGKNPPVGLGVPHIKTESVWELAALISSARIFIGVDSGPSWIAAAYPDIVTKIVRMSPKPDMFDEWIPLEAKNIHAHWDDRCRQIFNPTRRDIGFTQSYLKI